MRFLKKMRGRGPAAAYTMPTQLGALAIRAKLDVCDHPSADAEAEEAEPRALPVQRRFWTPHEVDEMNADRERDAEG